ncbi:phosphoenolpyruvate synthase [Hyaloraphidium curvatum]|nr:phosphoenolpyruvate synthase [Hyaloraphidium curvatum]
MSYIRWFNELALTDVPLVGGKNASLGELYRHLTKVGAKVPNGYAVTGNAYKDCLSPSDWAELHRLLDPINKENKTVAAIQNVGSKCRDVVYNGCMSPELEKQILAAYRKLCSEYHGEISVAVRSSATAEDLPDASFAGQHDSFLNIKGDAAVLDTYRKCCASLFTDRAISYRLDKGFDHFKVRLSVCIMKMVRSDIGAAGVIFTLDTETGHPDVVYITGSYGLGENVVQGAVDPDQAYVHKPTYKQGHRAVLSRILGKKQVTMVYDPKTFVKNLPTDPVKAARYCLTDAQIIKLAGDAIEIEDHYTKLRKDGQVQHMDIEWALDGVDGELYIVQARPETVHSMKRSARTLTTYAIGDTKKFKQLARGSAVGTKIATGHAHVVHRLEDLRHFKAGDILVAEMTTPDWEPIMKKASGIITDRGGRTCHAAIISRELGVPAVVGCEDATKAIEHGQMITLDCSQGEYGLVWDGKVPFSKDEIQLDKLRKPRTKVMVNLGNPELALKTAMLPCDGVGLARMEFIISEYIKIHPMALIHPEVVKDESEKARIRKILNGEKGPEYMVRRLSEGVGQIAAAFYPRPVVVRMSDFKSNEYAALLGGKGIEPHEENPMIGFRGASRYFHPAYEEGYALECAAMKRVREVMGLKNLILMIPFCRTVNEAIKVQEVMAKHGLKRGVNDLKMYVMCEIPNNVLSIDEFSKYFDGFSIGSNDLTQLTLGVDRDSGILKGYDERDPGVKAMLRLAIEGARRNKRHSGICGQAPSDYPDMAEFVVRHGIDSVSLTPDSVMKTTIVIANAEAHIGNSAPAARL